VSFAQAPASTLWKPLRAAQDGNWNEMDGDAQEIAPIATPAAHPSWRSSTVANKTGVAAEGLRIMLGAHAALGGG
jgi:hypothetical protein